MNGFPDNPNLKELVTQANGMLIISVYEEIYLTASKLYQPKIIEVGTAHGAATIALALGAKTQSEDFRIWTIDKMGGKYSSRSRFGSAIANMNIAIENFKNAGVADNINLYIGSPEEFKEDKSCPENIDCLMLDADGRIDRDFLLFYRLLAPGAPIIIDDVDDNIYLGRNYEGELFLDLKHRISNLLINAYIERGYITKLKQVKNTAFCVKNDVILDEQEFVRLSLNCYRELVINNVNNGYWYMVDDFIKNKYKYFEGKKNLEKMPSFLLKLMRYFYKD